MSKPNHIIPAEELLFEFEVGQHYLNCQGDLVEVVRKDDDGRVLWEVRIVKESADPVDSQDVGDTYTVDERGLFNAEIDNRDVWDLVPGTVETPEQIVYRLTQELESVKLDRATLLEENLALRKQLETDLTELRNEVAQTRQEHLDLGKSHREIASHNYDLCRKLQEYEDTISKQREALELESKRRKELGAEAKTWQYEYDAATQRVDGMQAVAVELANASRLYRTLLGEDAMISVEKQ